MVSEEQYNTEIKKENGRRQQNPWKNEPDNRQKKIKKRGKRKAE